MVIALINSLGHKVLVKNMNKKSILVLFLFALAIIGIIAPINAAIESAENIVKNEKKDTGITIDSKTKTIGYKITWNANGGKIASKKTITSGVVKGQKIAKLPPTPKRTGYTLKGWYTKKMVVLKLV